MALASLLLAAALAAEAPAPALHLGSVQGGETLGSGGTVASFSAGYSRLSATYAQGISDGADWGLVVDYDWATTALVLGGLWRQLLWTSGDVRVAWRVRGGLYGDLGATWVVSENHSDLGLELQPGLAASVRMGQNLLSLGADVPIDLTFSQGGAAIGLRGSLALEVPLQEDISVGGRLGVGSLWSTAGAPFGSDSPRATFDLGILLTFQLL